MDKVDVCINVFGKPWQTICTLESLMLNCEKYIDKIYVIREKEQPYNDKVDWIDDYFDNLIFYTPKNYNFIKKDFNFLDSDDILSFRYQYGIANTNKKYLFITHNDVLYTGDIIGNMLNLIGDAVGVGQIGQCWNCPLLDEGICNGDKLESNFEKNISYETVMSIVNRYPNKRTNYQCKSWISKSNPFPMPECRLNEWACLLNVEKVKQENYPNGKVPFFGQYSGVDLGSEWFIQMFKKGYKFVNYEKDFKHGYWADQSGHPVLTNMNEYKKSELIAKKYYEENFN
jgi:hypothetical protein